MKNRTFRISVITIFFFLLQYFNSLGIYRAVYGHESEAFKEKTTTEVPTAKNLSIPLVSFAYGNIANIKHSHSIESSVNTLLQFPFLVCTNPDHLSGEEIKVADKIKSKIKLFGYVNIGDSISLDEVKKEIDTLSKSSWYGVFIDQFGYDFGETRMRQNEIVDYAHEKGLKVFANAWHIDDALGDKADEIHNPQGEKTHLTKEDWFLIESFLTDNSGYREDIEAEFERYFKAVNYKKELGISIAALTYKNHHLNWENAKPEIAISYYLAISLGFDGWWYSDRLEDIEFHYGIPPTLKAVN